MTDNEKRMAGDYEITHSVRIGEFEIIMGENPNAPDGERYIVANGKQRNIFTSYESCYVNDDFIAIAEEFAQRLTEQVQQLKAEREKMPCDTKPIDRSGCTPLPSEGDIKGKVIVINPDALKPAYRVPTEQLYFARHGNGTSMRARGSAIYCTNLYSKEDTRMERYDVIGTIEPEKLPEWAKKGFDEITSKQEKSKKAKEAAR